MDLAVAGGELKFYAAIVVEFDCGRDVEVAKTDLLCAVIEDVHGLSHDGVVGDFLLMAVTENEHGRVDR